MNVIDSKTPEELARSLLAEIAKARNEIQCAQADIRKAESRMAFCIVLVNALIDRPKD